MTCHCYDTPDWAMTFFAWLRARRPISDRPILLGWAPDECTPDLAWTLRAAVRCQLAAAMYRMHSWTNWVWLRSLASKVAYHSSHAYCMPTVELVGDTAYRKIVVAGDLSPSALDEPFEQREIMLMIAECYAEMTGRSEQWAEDMLRLYESLTTS